MREGTVALTTLPQADGQTKARPVVLLRQMPGFGDWLVCGVSTQLQQEVKGFDEIITAQDRDFRETGLKAASVVRLGFLAVLPANRLLGILGSISDERHTRLLSRLVAHLEGSK